MVLPVIAGCFVGQHRAREIDQDEADGVVDIEQQGFAGQRRVEPLEEDLEGEHPDDDPAAEARQEEETILSRRTGDVAASRMAAAQRDGEHRVRHLHWARASVQRYWPMLRAAPSIGRRTPAETGWPQVGWASPPRAILRHRLRPLLCSVQLTGERSRTTTHGVVPRARDARGRGPDPGAPGTEMSLVPGRAMSAG